MTPSDIVPTTLPSADQDAQKRAVAAAALAWALPRLAADVVVGIGTGSTADQFIDLLAPHAARFAGAVASSSRSADRLRAGGVQVFDLDTVGELPFYVDGADEINGRFEMIKGGGGALTREKIVASAARTFVCIVDASKQVERLGKFPLPIEVIPMARSHVMRKLETLARARGLAAPTMRIRTGANGAPYVTDNGNPIIDVSGWSIADACELEAAICAIVGVVESGLFALRAADVLVVPEGSAISTKERDAP
jgi:ribose 5-phosphate isomerase A